MTTDTKQPPDTDRFVLVKTREGIFTACFKAQPDRYSTTGRWFRVEDVEDWREMPSWDRLRILDTYDEERKEWGAHAKDGFDRADAALRECDALRSQVADLTEGMNSAIAHAVVERKELTALRSQVTALQRERDQAVEDLQEDQKALARADRAEKERDEACEWRRQVAIALDCVKDNGTIGDVGYVVSHALALRRFAAERDTAVANVAKISDRAQAHMDGVMAERDRAIAERDEAMGHTRNAQRQRDEATTERNRAVAERDSYRERAIYFETLADTVKAVRAQVDEDLAKAIAERDDLGCQLEALRSVQRGDVADLRARMGAMERWRDTSEMPNPCAWCSLSATTTKKGRHWCGTCRRREHDDEKGGA